MSYFFLSLWAVSGFLVLKSLVQEIVIQIALNINQNSEAKSS